MKNFTRFLMIAVVGLAFSANTFAQASANATATATIYTAIGIAQVDNMSFGNIIPGATGGNVVLDPVTETAAYGGTTSSSAVPVATSTIQAAEFTVSGTPAATYAITLPAGPVVLTGPGAATMNATVFTSTPTPTGTLSGTGSQTLRVGATLTVAAGQAPGTYTSGNFIVQVAYN